MCACGFEAPCERDINRKNDMQPWLEIDGMVLGPLQHSNLLANLFQRLKDWQLIYIDECDVIHKI